MTKLNIGRKDYHPNTYHPIPAVGCIYRILVAIAMTWKPHIPRQFNTQLGYQYHPSGRGRGRSSLLAIEHVKRTGSGDTARRGLVVIDKLYAPVRGATRSMGILQDPKTHGTSHDTNILQ